MKAISLFGLCAAGLLVMAAAVAHGQMSTSGGTPKVEAVADATGNLHVPDTYRTTYQFLGSWAVAEGQSTGVKELHVVYSSPGTIDAYRNDGRFPDGAVLVKEVFQTATGQMTTGTVSRAEN